MRRRLGQMLVRWGHALSGNGKPQPDPHERNIVQMRETKQAVRQVLIQKKARPSGNPIGDSIARRGREGVRRHG